MSILEAAGLGLPVVTRRRPYLTGVDLPLVVDDPTEFAAAVTALVRPGALESLRKVTADALAGNTDAYQRAALCELYGPAKEAT